MPNVTPNLGLAPVFILHDLLSNCTIHAIVLLQLEDFEYKPLDPKDIRLPPPMPPTERLLAAVEAFYQPPSRERPRDV